MVLRWRGLLGESQQPSFSLQGWTKVDNSVQAELGSEGTCPEISLSFRLLSPGPTDTLVKLFMDESLD